ncbi:MAG: hypothetical protein AAF799_09425 [Myxococcota bacterium]
MSALSVMERQRWKAQLAALQERLREDEAALAACPPADAPRRRALSRVIEEQNSDERRMVAALDGRRPSAVAGREDPPPSQLAAAIRAFAFDEAIHIAENALHYLPEKIPQDALALDAVLLRTGRWLLRLDRELRDVQCPRPESIDYHDLVIDLLVDPDPAAALGALRSTLERELKALGANR